MDFSSVNDFLHKAQASKEPARRAIQDGIEGLIIDENTVAIPPHLSASINDLVETFGDEALRQIAIFCIAKWSEIHQGIAQDQFESEDIHALLLTSVDLTRMTDCLHCLKEIASFGGPEDWNDMIIANTSQAVLERIEEKGIDAKRWRDLFKP